MTPDEMRVAIGEVMGFKWYRWGDHPDAQLFFCNISGWKHDPVSFVPATRKKDEKYRADDLPDYPNDLNAMHEAEKVLTKQQHFQRMNHLNDIVPPADTDYYGRSVTTNTATAHQRCEAFCRTLWPERFL